MRRTLGRLGLAGALLTAVVICPVMPASAAAPAKKRPNRFITRLNS